jgi:hypothetical protein
VFLLGNVKEAIVMQSIPLDWVADQMTAVRLRLLDQPEVTAGEQLNGALCRLHADGEASFAKILAKLPKRLALGGPVPF